jgi:C-terminal processing protease CtpA/Prc
MKRIIEILIICCISFQFSNAQNFGSLPKIKKDKLLNDLEILYQGLDKFHSGMYWYTPKDSVDMAFQDVRKKITKDLNVLEFHKLIAPLVALSREDHTDIYRPKIVREKLNSEIRLLPLTVVFLSDKLYCVKNGSDFQDFPLEGKQIESINGETPKSIVDKIGNLFASDGFIKTVKYSDLEAFNFSTYYYYYYGQVDQFEIKFKNIKEPLIIKPLKRKAITQYLNSRYQGQKKTDVKDVLVYKTLSDSIAYLGIHTFDNDDIKKYSKVKKLSVFLKNSFKSIQENNIQTLVIDISNNTGGSEGNEGLLYSYFGENYQKYKMVRVKTQKAILDNGTDKPISIKAFGLWERLFINKKMNDGSLERRACIGKGLMAYKKEPDYKFSGKTYVIISPVTYSGGSEFSNMMYTQDLATFVGQETGGSYLGNTSGYGKELVLPNSKIKVSIPALQFVMNVKPTLPFGRGVIPQYEVVPTFEEYINGENAPLKYILKQLENEK